MALPATGIIEIRSTATANNVNGGGFNSARGGTDYTLQNAAQLNPTDLTSVLASTTITSAIGGFTSVMVGNYIHITAGTNFVAGWYEIVTFTDANNVVVDRACTVTAAGSAGVGYVGGAMSLGSTLDDDLFEIAVAGNLFYVKGGAGPITYTLGEGVSITAAGGASNPIKIIGYATTRGDAPTGVTRPIIAMGANGFSLGANWEASNLIVIGTAAQLFSLGAGGKTINCKVYNSSSVANRTAIYATNSDPFLYRTEGISLRGYGLYDYGICWVDSCYFHDSNIGRILGNNSSVPTFAINTIFADNVTTAIDNLGLRLSNVVLAHCTLYGAENKLGTGVNLLTGTTDFKILNTIIYGFVTGVTHADVQSVGFDDYNDYFNNTTDVTNWTKGANSIAVNPAFTSVAQLTGSTATTSGSVLTQSGGDFSTVTDNVDFVYIKSGTGVTVGKYMITSHTATTITLDIAPGTNATADKVWQITTGHNFLPTGAI